MFNLLKPHLTRTPVLGNSDFIHPFNLETDASLQGLEIVLSQKDKNCQSKVIAYASQSMHPNEKKIRYYSSAKLELNALKRAVMEKLQDYVFGSKFTMYTDNNPLAYVRESKLGVAQINWLSKPVLFDFDIRYRTGKSIKQQMLWAIVPMSQKRWIMIQNQNNMRLFIMLWTVKNWKN